MGYYDFTIAGGGVIGLTLAINLKKEYPDCSVLLLEKESSTGLHASGRNSGVLHAGFYYAADSLKARFTRDGNAALGQYCEEKGLRINRCGKLVVCKNESEHKVLFELEKRGKANQIELHLLREEEAKDIEPRVKTKGYALWSPTTSSVDPTEIMTSLLADAINLGVSVKTGTCYQSVDQTRKQIKTNKGSINFGYFINAAGLYADKISHDWGFSNDYRILPFKGLYLYANPNPLGYKPVTHIYPVPDLKYPFLGVHFTLTVDGDFKIGPTAIPAFWREHYSGLTGFKISETSEIIFRNIQLLINNNFGFRDLAVNEIKKYNKNHLINDASMMFEKIDDMSFVKWGKPGIRAQLVNIKEKKIEMDFLFEGDDRSFHVLNAVSPAFTCSGPFTKYLVEKIDSLIS